MVWLEMPGFVATDRAGKCQTFGQKYSHFQVSHLHYSLADILSKISVMLPQTIFLKKKSRCLLEKHLVVSHQ